jgi:hypothetical protein
MNPARLTFEDAPAFIPVPENFQHHRLEVIFWPLESVNVNLSKRRLPPDALRGKVREIGDVMQSVPLEDWGV